MQTFLPYPDVKKSLEVLDYRRLGKQRVECKQILKAIYLGSGWKHHPAVKMWIGSEDYLSYYYNCCIDQWVSRGYKNNMFKINLVNIPTPPLWFGNEKFHSSHRANLLRKNIEYYSQFGWNEEPMEGYYWPTKGGY